MTDSRSAPKCRPSHSAAASPPGDAEVGQGPPTAAKPWPRRAWLTHTAVHSLMAAGALRTQSWSGRGRPSLGLPVDRLGRPQETGLTDERTDDWDALALRAVDAAKAAGADYADAHLTHTLLHSYGIGRGNPRHRETIGVGVRALVNGYWGFTACPSCDAQTIAQLAQQAVTQARMNARNTPRAVDLGSRPTASGRWATPVQIDPFTIPVEEKWAFCDYWNACADRAGMTITPPSYLLFIRQERLVATTDGVHIRQTVYESGGTIQVSDRDNRVRLLIQGIAPAGQGWELILNAKIPEQLAAMPVDMEMLKALPTRGATVGRYTLVCDAATMAALLSTTLGVATQLDRALGYEANAGGTSFLTDPLGMLGTFQLAAPTVTVTANRSAPTQLATVKWDDEGIEPPETTLVKDGILADFQTTREQATWLAPFYQKTGRPVRSAGCAAAETALTVTMQHMPNLRLAPSASALRLEDLIADVKNGIFVEQGCVIQVDQQARNGLMMTGGSLLGDSRSHMREIRNGRLGPVMGGGAIWFDTLDLWKHIAVLGGRTTETVRSMSPYPYSGRLLAATSWGDVLQVPVKGQPPQATSHSVQAVAATIPNQPLINLARKA